MPNLSLLDNIRAPESLPQLQRADLSDLARALGSAPEGSIPASDLYWLFLDVRNDAPDALIEAAGVIHEASLAAIDDPGYREQLRAEKSDVRAQVAAACALHKLRTAGQPPPDAFDDFLYFWAFDPESYDGFDILYNALKHLPGPRLRAALERAFANNDLGAVAFVPLVSEPDLVDRAVEMLEQNVRVFVDAPDVERDARVLRTLIDLGRDVVTPLRRGIMRYNSEDSRGQLAAAVAAAATRMRELGGAFEPQLDHVLQAPLATASTAAADAPPAMEPWSIARLQQLAAQASADKPKSKRTRIYVLVLDRRDPDATELNRTAGAPVGIAKDRWPRVGGRAQGEPMRHVLTLDLESVPELRGDKAFARVRALAFFVTNTDEGVGAEPGNTETLLLPVSDAHVKRGAVVDPLPYDAFDAAGTFSLVALDVPTAVFNDDAEEGSLDPLRRALRNAPGRVLGEPIWMQNKPRKGLRGLGRFLFQFNESLVEINLGDGGEMYVFEKGAFWRSN
ncbi:MAG: hypothetical protein JWO36_4940 [Myxococcales bacterium]|nr:hypothetical protein [Myxococcales bacterium]